MCMRKGVGLIFVLLSLGVGALSGFLNMEAMSQYQVLNQPPLSPPAWVFPVAWTILYILMGVGAAMVYCSNEDKKKTALILFFVQLFFNFCWSFFFFTLEWRLFAFIWLVALLILVLAMTNAFGKISPLAAKLQIPYILWLCFAAYLNFGVWWLNR